MTKHFFNELDNDIQNSIKSIEGITDEFLMRTYLMKGFDMEEIENNISAPTL